MEVWLPSLKTRLPRLPRSHLPRSGGPWVLPPKLRSFLYSECPSLVTAETLASANRKAVWWRQYNPVPCNLIYAPVLILLFLTDIILKRYFPYSQQTRFLRLSRISVQSTHLRQKSVIHPAYLLRNFSIRLSNLGAKHYIASYCSMRLK